MKLDQMLCLLDNVSQRGEQFKALCPAHDDKNPSLAITEKDNKILLKCWSGCAAAEIVDALGLKLSDLFTESGMSLQQRKQHAKKKNKHVLRQALAFELYMLLQYLNTRISDAECANNTNYKKARPEFVPMPEDPWDREIQAVNLILEISGELYE